MSKEEFYVHTAVRCTMQPQRLQIIDKSYCTVHMRSTSYNVKSRGVKNIEIVVWEVFMHAPFFILCFACNDALHVMMRYACLHVKD